jgi:hypothetical protein
MMFGGATVVRPGRAALPQTAADLWSAAMVEALPYLFVIAAVVVFWFVFQRLADR